MIRVAIVMFVLLISTGAIAKQQTYEAVIRFPGGNTGHVTVDAPDWFTAKDQIQARYCGGTDCIVESPWSLPERH